MLSLSVIQGFYLTPSGQKKIVVKSTSYNLKGTQKMKSNDIQISIIIISGPKFCNKNLKPVIDKCNCQKMALIGQQSIQFYKKKLYHI